MNAIRVYVISRKLVVCVPAPKNCRETPLPLTARNTSPRFFSQKSSELVHKLYLAFDDRSVET